MWMSTTRGRRPSRRSVSGSSEAGFSLIELLLGLTLSVCLALGLAPLWVSFQSVAATEGDQMVWMAQARVATARLERDVRVAGFATCPFASSSIVLQAGPSQVVMLTRPPGSQTSLLVEWELVNGSLMRRWGACPALRPAAFPHSLYSDSKTMLENVDTARSLFAYRVAGRDVGQPGPADLSSIDRVEVRIVEKAAPAGRAPSVRAAALVGR